MRVLFDNGVPRPLARMLLSHEVTLSRTLRWHELKYGHLLNVAKAAGYDILLTTDKNIAYQQNLSTRNIALVVLSNQQWPEVKLRLAEIARALDEATPGSYTEVFIDLRPKRAPRPA